MQGELGNSMEMINNKVSISPDTKNAIAKIKFAKAIFLIVKAISAKHLRKTFFNGVKRKLSTLNAYICLYIKNLKIP